MKKIGILIFILTIFSLSAFAQKTRKSHGYVEIGGGFSVADNKGGYAKADLMYGYTFNPTSSIRLGVGARYAPVNADKGKPWAAPGNNWGLLLPFIGNYRANLGYQKFEKIYPYIQSGLGIALPGIVFNQSIGIGLKNAPFSIGLGGEVIALFHEVETSGFATFLGLNIGISF